MRCLTTRCHHFAACRPLTPAAAIPDTVSDAISASRPDATLPRCRLYFSAPMRHFSWLMQRRFFSLLLAHAPRYRRCADVFPRHGYRTLPPRPCSVVWEDIYAFIICLSPRRAFPPPQTALLRQARLYRFTISSRT